MRKRKESGSSSTRGRPDSSASSHEYKDSGRKPNVRKRKESGSSSTRGRPDSSARSHEYKDSGRKPKKKPRRSPRAESSPSTEQFPDTGRRPPSQRGTPPFNFLKDLTSFLNEKGITEKSSYEEILENLYKQKPFCSKKEYRRPGGVAQYTLVKLGKSADQICVNKVLPIVFAILEQCRVNELLARDISTIFSQLGLLANNDIKLPKKFFQSQVPTNLLTHFAATECDSEQVGISSTLTGLVRLAKKGYLQDGWAPPKCINVLLNRFITLKPSMILLANVIHALGWLARTKRMPTDFAGKGLLNSLLVNFMFEVEQTLASRNKMIDKVQYHISYIFLDLRNLLTTKVISINDIPPWIIPALLKIMYDSTNSPRNEEIAIIMGALKHIIRSNKRLLNQNVSIEFINKSISCFSGQQATCRNIADFLEGLSEYNEAVLEKTLSKNKNFLSLLLSAFIDKTKSLKSVHKIQNIERVLLGLKNFAIRKIPIDNFENSLIELLEINNKAICDILMQSRRSSNQLINASIRHLPVMIERIFYYLRVMSVWHEISVGCLSKTVDPLLKCLLDPQVEKNFPRMIYLITSLRRLAEVDRIKPGYIENSTFIALVKSLKYMSSATQDINKVLHSLAYLAKKHILPRGCLTSEILNGFLEQLRPNNELISNCMTLHSLGMFADERGLPDSFNRECILELFNQLRSAEGLDPPYIAMAVVGAGKLVLANQTPENFLALSAATWKKLLGLLGQLNANTARSEVMSMLLELMAAKKIPDNFFISDIPAGKTSLQKPDIAVVPSTTISNLDESKLTSSSIVSMPPLSLEVGAYQDEKSKDADIATTAAIELPAVPADLDKNEDINIAAMDDSIELPAVPPDQGEKDEDINRAAMDDLIELPAVPDDQGEKDEYIDIVAMDDPIELPAVPDDQGEKDEYIDIAADDPIELPAVPDDQGKKNEDIDMAAMDPIKSTTAPTDTKAELPMELEKTAPIALVPSLDVLSSPLVLTAQTSSTETPLTIAVDEKPDKKREKHYPKSKSSWRKAIEDIRGNSIDGENCVELAKDLIDFSKTGEAKAGTPCQYQEQVEVVVRNQMSSEKKLQTVVSTITTKISFGAQQRMMYHLNYLLGSGLNYKDFNDAHLEKQAIAHGGWFSGVIALSRIAVFDQQMSLYKAKKKHSWGEAGDMGHLVAFQYVSDDYNRHLPEEYRLPDAERLMIFDPQELVGGKSKPEFLVIYSSLEQAYFTGENEFFDTITFTALDSPVLHRKQDSFAGDDSDDLLEGDTFEDDTLEDDLSRFEDIKLKESKNEEIKPTKIHSTVSEVKATVPPSIAPLPNYLEQLIRPPKPTLQQTSLQTPLEDKKITQPLTVDPPKDLLLTTQLPQKLPRPQSRGQSQPDAKLPEGMQPVYCEHDKYSLYLSITLAVLLPLLNKRDEFNSQYLKLFGRNQVKVAGTLEDAGMTMANIYNTLKSDWQSKTLCDDVRLKALLQIFYSRARAKVQQGGTFMEIISQMVGVNMEISFLTDKPKKEFNCPGSKQKIYLVERVNKSYYCGLPIELCNKLNAKKDKKSVQDQKAIRFWHSAASKTADPILDKSSSLLRSPGSLS